MALPIARVCMDMKEESLAVNDRNGSSYEQEEGGAIDSKIAARKLGPNDGHYLRRSN